MNTHAVVGNTIDDREDVKVGALCYITNFSLATGSVEVMVVNREGEWISQWREGNSLTNFRAKMVPPNHPASKTTIAPPAARGRAQTLIKAFPGASAATPEMETEVKTEVDPTE